MPKLTRTFIKTSLVYLIGAFLLAVVVAARPVLNLPPWVNALTPVYFHMFMVGWVAQLIFGIVYWMFPKFSVDRPRGNESVAWSVYWLLNAGLLLRIVGEPALASGGAALWRWVLLLSAILQWLAGLGFAANIWPRVKER